MIRNITSTSPSLSVYSHSTPIYNNGLSAGQMRYNTVSQSVEVYDGNSWYAVSSQASVGLTPEVEELLDWARSKKKQEEQLEDKLERYPALRSAYDEFKLIEALVYEEDTKP